VELLGRLTALHLDGTVVAAEVEGAAAAEGAAVAAAREALVGAVKGHPATNGEVKALLGDLQVGSARGGCLCWGRGAGRCGVGSWGVDCIETDTAS